MLNNINSPNNGQSLEHNVLARSATCYSISWLLKCSVDFDASLCAPARPLASHLSHESLLAPEKCHIHTIAGILLCRWGIDQGRAHTLRALERKICGALLATVSRVANYVKAVALYLGLRALV